MRRFSPPPGVAQLDVAAAALAQRFLDRVEVADGLGHEHLRRDRGRRGVVLEHELLGYLALAALARVVEVEALAVRQHAVADLEDLGVGLGVLGGHGDRVERAHGAVRYALPLEQMPDRLEPVAVHRGLLELLLGRGVLHLALDIALDLAVAAAQEVDDRVDRLAVLLLRHVADARRAAALDEVVEARAARGAAGLGAVTATVLEDLAEQVERLADTLRVAVRAEVGAVAAVLLAREVDPREVLVEADRDVRVRLVVSQPDVVARAVLADEVLLGEQRLHLGLGGDVLDVRDLVEQTRGAARGGVREVPRHALLERLRLAHVEHPALRVAEQVDARRIGDGAP